MRIQKWGQKTVMSKWRSWTLRLYNLPSHQDHRRNIHSCFTGLTTGLLFLLHAPLPSPQSSFATYEYNHGNKKPTFNAFSHVQYYGLRLLVLSSFQSVLSSCEMFMTSRAFVTNSAGLSHNVASVLFILSCCILFTTHAHEILFITITGTQLFAKYREISLDKILTGFSMKKGNKRLSDT